MLVEKEVLILKSETKSITKLETYLHNILSPLNLGEDKYGDILISLTEAVTNAIIHGNKEDQSKKVVINHWVDENSIYLKVCDQGNGFDPTCIKDPTCPSCIEITGGRGVFLMCQLADDIQFNDRGTQVELKFNLK